MDSNLAIALVAVFAALACALAGVFLVLRRMAMMADAISHAILPGLVAGYVLANGPNLVTGFLGAAAAGLLTVFLVEALTGSRRVREDAAIGIVFPALFALGVFIISSTELRNVHLDTDAILFGEIAFAPFDTLQIGGRDYGPQALWVLGGLTIVNGLFLTVFYKELKLSTFDTGLAAALGFTPVLLHYALMALVAVTTVGALSAVGAILVVGLFIVPAATASLLTRRLPLLITLAIGIGVAAALGGFALAIRWDVSISGMIAAVLGALFGAAFLGSPQQGLVAQFLRRARQKRRFATETLLGHLATHENTATQAEESATDHLETELRWRPQEARRIIEGARDSGFLTEEGGALHLTDEGRSRADTVSQR